MTRAVSTTVAMLLALSATAPTGAAVASESPQGEASITVRTKSLGDNRFRVTARVHLTVDGANVPASGKARLQIRYSEVWVIVRNSKQDAETGSKIKWTWRLPAKARALRATFRDQSGVRAHSNVIDLT